MRRERVDDCADLILEVGDAYLALGEHQCALRYYELLDGNSAFDNVRCSSSAISCDTFLVLFHVSRSRKSAAFIYSVLMLYGVLEEAAQ